MPSPPPPVAVASPVISPKQATAKLSAAIPVTAAVSVIVTGATTEQPAPSVIVTEHDPAPNPVATIPV